jgi:4-amino-4-deoxy-L-arabinose transferase-like glycosyltransferase
LAIPVVSLLTLSDSKHASRISRLILPGLILLALAGCLFFLGLGSLPLLEPDEGRNAEVAREMLVSGDWITPHYDTLTYLDKPAVYFWLVAGSFRVGGINEWAARIPSALMALATLLLVWLLGRTMGGASAGLRAAVVFATCPLAIAFAHLVIFDMLLAFLMALVMTVFWIAKSEGYRDPRLDMLLFAALGVATVTKGPVGFLVPLLSIVVYEAVRGKGGDLKRLRWGLGVAVFLAAVLPWFIAVSIRNPDFPRYALWQESLQRFVTGGQVHRQGGLFYYVPVYLAGFFPWSLCLLFAAWTRRKQWRELRQENHRAGLFLLVWAMTVFVFFSISRSQLPGYFLPATVPLSILMARVWEDGSPGVGAPPDWLTAGFAALLGLGLVIAVGSQPWVFAGAKAALAKKLHPAVFGMLQPSLLYTGLILGALGILGRNVASRARGASLSAITFALLALTVPLLMVRWLPVLKVFAEAHSSRRLAKTLRASPEKDWPIYGYYYFRTSLPFYLQRPVGLVTFDSSELTSNYQVSHFWEVQRRKRSPVAMGAKTSAEAHLTFADLDPVPLGERRLLDILELTALTGSSRQSRLILVRNTHVGEVGQTFGDIEPLWNGWDYSVWKIPPGKPAPGAQKPHRIVSPFRP